MCLGMAHCPCLIAMAWTDGFWGQRVHFPGRKQTIYTDPQLLFWGWAFFLFIAFYMPFLQ